MYFVSLQFLLPAGGLSTIKYCRTTQLLLMKEAEAAASALNTAIASVMFKLQLD